MSPDPVIFSQPWYDEYYRRADASPTHSKFCERVYGRDLCQHGMMDMQELNFLISMLQLGGHTLDIGCGSGRISEYIQRYASGSLLGIDFSKVAISQAKARQKAKNGLEFSCLDATQEKLPAGPYDAILLIDSVYYLGETTPLLQRLVPLLKPRGRIVISALQTREKGDPKNILQAEHTHIAKALDAAGCRWVAYDFTGNIRKYWLNNVEAAEALKPNFLAEGNQFLYDARHAENEPYKKHIEAETITRHLYVIDNHNR